MALDLLTSGQIAYGKHHFSIMVYSPSLENLVADTNEISNALNNIGITGDGYYSNLHNALADKDECNEKNPASTCILGTNGAGKTMLMTFFEIMQQK